MKKWKGCLLVIVATICLFWIFPEQTPAASDSVIVSVEKSTLGQGFIVEPTTVQLKSGDTAKTVTERVLNSNGIKFKASKENSVGYYLSGIEDPGRGKINPPEFLKTQIAAQDITITEDKTPDYLSEYDYTKQSGWMYSVDGVFPDHAADAVSLKGGEVIRWQFTLIGYGEDVKNGDPSIAPSERLSGSYSREKIYPVLAYIKATEELRGKDEVNTAYRNCVKAAGDLTTGKSGIRTYLGVLNNAAEIGIISTVKLEEGTSSETVAEYGTEQSSIRFPETLTAQKDTKDNSTTIKLTGITWECLKGYDSMKAGYYYFTPVITLNSGQYLLKNGIQFPTFKVVLLKENGETPKPENPPAPGLSPTPTPSPASVKVKAGYKTVKAGYAKKTIALKISAEKGASVVVKSGDTRVVSIDSKRNAVIRGTGKTEIRVTASLKGRKTTTLKIPVYISPAKQPTPAARSKKSRQLTVSWKKDSNASGYQVMYSTDKNFRKKCKTVTVKSYKTVSTAIKKLTGNKYYYVRTRSYKKVSGGNLYGSWSTARKIKVRK